MNGLPLHPVVVHLPIALGFILPLFTIVICFCMAKNILENKTWYLVIFLQLIFVSSLFMAIETGEKEEDKVGEVIGETWVEWHEEQTEALMPMGLLVLALNAVALVKNSKIKKTSQGLSVLGMMITAWFLVGAGHSGGEMVYLKGATKAYQNTSTQPSESNE